jgi:hypothetical protein
MIVRYIAFRAIGMIALLSAMVLGLSIWVDAQDRPKLSEGAPQTQPGAGHPPALAAKLIDPEKKAKQQAATVAVQVAGVQLVDPAAVHEQPQPGQGHLHYQIDDGPVIATTATKLSFHELSFGQHKITVILAGNDHKPLGPQETLTVTIPQGGNGRAQR